VIVDVYLRGTSGLALQRTLAERQVPIPIIFLTGRDDPALARQAREAGAVAWLIKPVLEQDLWQAIKAAQHQTGP
jgi:FixJ family two-component response regulator